MLGGDGVYPFLVCNRQLFGLCIHPDGQLPRERESSDQGLHRALLAVAEYGAEWAKP